MHRIPILLVFLCSIVSAAPPDTNWSVSVRRDKPSGRPVICRFRSSIPKGINTRTFPNLIAISWHYESTSGMPSPEIKQQMNVLEESLEKIVESTPNAVMTVIATGDGVAEWQFYTNDKTRFMQLVNSALSSKEKFPIQFIDLKKDPNWLAYRKFLSAN